MKMIAGLFASGAALVAIVAAAGFTLDFAVLISIGSTAGIVGLYVHDYRRIRQGRPSPRVRRN